MPPSSDAHAQQLCDAVMNAEQVLRLQAAVADVA